MLLKTAQFGEIEINENKKIIFKEGIPGFETLKEYILLEDEDIESPFKYLQSAQQEDVCFVILNPYMFNINYTPTIKEEYFEKLGGGKDEDFFIFVITTVGKTLEETTVNLMAPLLIHQETRLGLQVIVEEDAYTTKHPILDFKTERS
ncbi:flagellar assembly protein FliW [Cellulosilyticum sp. I15G10I2]|uniref:flagellar assembly protein FliW n=1 Tax=Cellulosilyticum sp. I15G10I2 TaxID=1892843 RepID=UPI00085C3ABB|nr:flagellar assembly protein FliW [Cellulosilyticum sp. I15G10I2]